MVVPQVLEAVAKEVSPKAYMKSLLIVFVKNPIAGKVKSRLAMTIGEGSALTVYLELLNITETAIQNYPCDKIIYFSESKDGNVFHSYEKELQSGKDLGERMHNAFKEGFARGYEHIVLIGSDLPDLQPDIISEAFEKLQNYPTVFGPSEDGGYYLIGLSELVQFPFQNKRWSTANLLKETLNELDNNNISYALTGMLNDIDTFEDLLKSETLKTNKTINSELKMFYDTRN